MKFNRASNKKPRIDLNLDNDPIFKKGPLFDEDDDEMELDGGKISKKKTIRKKKKIRRKKTNRKVKKIKKSQRKK
jgi:hypothetical protein